jgi:hypothetical protein
MGQVNDYYQIMISGTPFILTNTAGSSTAVALLLLTLLLTVLLACYCTWRRLQNDRWALVRCHNWAWVRAIYQSLAIYKLAWRLDRAVQMLPPPIDALEVWPGCTAVLDEILAHGPDTYQKKPTNRAQIDSLLNCVCQLVSEVQQHQQRNSGGATITPLVLDIGAGKALFTRAVYEALDRQVAVVALDSRRPHKGDQFYDPDPKEQKANDEDAPYTRVVADVRYLAARTLIPLKEAKNGGVIAITKHLCGGATDGSLIALCAPPLDSFVGACCFAPCCHQKMTRRDQYCNIPYLESLGFCETHIGLRGGVQDNDFRSFGRLISMSKHNNNTTTSGADGLVLEDFEYKKSVLLKVLGIQRARQLGRHTRRILEEGRMRYLREHGFDAHLVRYCDASITGDNLAIIARRRRRPVEVKVKDKSQ